jgi:hypothetical protein
MTTDRKLLALEEDLYAAKEEFLAAILAFSQEPGSVPVKELSSLARKFETRYRRVQEASPVEYADVLTFPRKIA